MKICSICKQNKDRVNFCKDIARKDKLCHVCKKCRSVWGKTYRKKLKIEIFNAYGGPVCKCCNEKEICFLSLDHVNNDGAKERKELFKNNHGGSYHLYEKLKQKCFPDKNRYQVLCMNCQWGKKNNFGICPHQQK